MILNPISIATQGVYSNNINLGLASKGYIDLTGEAVEIPAGNAGIWINQRQEEDDIMVIINTFLTMKH